MYDDDDDDDVVFSYADRKF